MLSEAMVGPRHQSRGHALATQMQRTTPLSCASAS